MVAQDDHAVGVPEEFPDEALLRPRPRSVLLIVTAAVQVEQNGNARSFRNPRKNHLAPCRTARGNIHMHKGDGTGGTTLCKLSQRQRCRQMAEHRRSAKPGLLNECIQLRVTHGQFPRQIQHYAFDAALPLKPIGYEDGNLTADTRIHCAAPSHGPETPRQWR